MLCRWCCRVKALIFHIYIFFSTRTFTFLLLFLCKVALLVVCTNYFVQYMIRLSYTTTSCTYEYELVVFSFSTFGGDFLFVVSAVYLSSVFSSLIFGCFVWSRRNQHTETSCFLLLCACVRESVSVSVSLWWCSGATVVEHCCSMQTHSSMIVAYTARLAT